MKMNDEKAKRYVKRALRAYARIHPPKGLEFVQFTEEDPSDTELIVDFVDNDGRVSIIQMDVQGDDLDG